MVRARIWLLLASLGLAGCKTDMPFWAYDQDCDGRVTAYEWLWGGFDQGFKTGDGYWEVFEYKDGLPVARWRGAPLRCTPCQPY